ncbi:MAG: hypothetical protein JO227_12415 [Acetobacteraceae bacterium]|nr:hypothetical protein [Acetobacteraceae bacterium]
MTHLATETPSGAGMLFTRQTRLPEQAAIEKYTQPITLTDAELEAVAGGMYGGSIINGE